ncbi:MAG: hypothetical protein WKF35_08880 [Ferruginibacter sp.]
MFHTKIKRSQCLQLFVAVIVTIITPQLIFAQRDTSRKPAIDITSSFKPVIRNAVKINFSGSQLIADTSKPRLTYSIPSQNLFYSYQPVTLKPLALSQDTNLYLGNRHFIKAGFGSYSTPYLSAGISTGDGKRSLVNFYGSYIASKGNIKNQDYSELKIKATGSYFSGKNEFYGAAALKNDDYYLYGYDHSLFDFKKQDVRQQFQDVTVSAGFRNTAATKFRLSYDPNVAVNFFTNREKASETNIMVNIPVEKKVADNFNVKVDFKGEFTNYTTINFIPQNIIIRNNLIQLAPSVIYSQPLFKINGGVTPVWNDGKYSVLPNIYFEAQLQEKTFLVQGGWVGRYIKNTYRNLTEINPYLDPLVSQDNTKETELYGGIKASLGSHFNINAKASFISYTDMPIFINDTSSDSKSFIISNEPSMNNLRIHGDVSYINQDKFTLNAGFNLNGYTGLIVNKKAWNTLPLQVTGSFRWWAYRHLVIKSDLFIFGGGNALVKGNNSFATQGGFDLSAGAEYKINKQFSAWLDVNNILNDRYERWHRYPVYGLNVLGGIIIRF